MEIPRFASEGRDTVESGIVIPTEVEGSTIYSRLYQNFLMMQDKKEMISVKKL